MATKTFTVSKISCNHCVMTIERALGALDGVAAVSVDAAAKTVKVEWNEPPATCDAICSALEDVGYPPDEEATGRQEAEGGGRKPGCCG